MNETTEQPNTGREGLYAAGGLIGALLASSCCIVPFLLLTLGVGGAWVGNLTALATYQPIFLTVAVALLAVGFWKVYRKPKNACAPGSYCATPASGRVIRIALWAATLLIIAAVAVNLIAPLFI
ncbi:hypothetical protein MNBD_GAMMA17-418 [hydrothermal vent metagenome]|uniref:Mercuric transport protein, MerT n=1 Tax=hydrothermal vent metagenome TaxID=652676 RepID=A0A3B0ZLZ3_9ZZZZ